MGGHETGQDPARSRAAPGTEVAWTSDRSPGRVAAG